MNKNLNHSGNDTTGDFFAEQKQQLKSEARKSVLRQKQKKKSDSPSKTAEPALNILPASLQTKGGSGISIESLRISTEYGKQFAVKKMLTTIRVGKPNKSSFIMVRSGENWEFLAYIYDNKEVGETYLLTPEVAINFPDIVRPVRLHLAVDRRENPIIIPVQLPGEDGRRNLWHESLTQAIERAKQQWVRIVANMSAGGYDVLVAQADLAGPVWPEQSMTELIEIAFRGKIISSLDHPVLRELMGCV